MGDLPGMMARQYAVSQFENNVINAIPVKWMCKAHGKLFCYWTSSCQRLMLSELLSPNWPAWSIVKMLGCRGQYKHCTSFDVLIILD
jgi:hypothetical protein